MSAKVHDVNKLADDFVSAGAETLASLLIAIGNRMTDADIEAAINHTINFTGDDEDKALDKVAYAFAIDYVRM